jgi:VanZ family protein
MIPWLRHRSTLFWARLYAAWFLVLCILSSMSHPGPHIDIVGFDKVEHCAYFWAGGLTLGLALSQHRAAPKFLGIILLIVGAAVGWFDEWHQSFTPGRSGLDVYDWIADCTGSALAALTLPAMRKFLAA